jgi:rhodanese-related sulfurtransferase
VQYRVIDVEGLAAVLEGGDLASGAVALIDVRTPEEFDEVRIPGAVLVPLADLPERVEEIPDDRTVYLVCRSGGRSGKACEFLAPSGRDVVNLDGGTMAWVESGRATESGPIG